MIMAFQRTQSGNYVGRLPLNPESFAREKR